MNALGWPLRAALGVAIGLYLLSFKQPVGAIVLGLVLVASLLPVRTEVDRIGQLIVALVCLVGAYVLVIVVGPELDHPISKGFARAQGFLCVWALLLACLRLFFSNPWGGHRMTVFFSLGAVFACGVYKIGWSYQIGVGIYSIFALWAMAQDDPVRPDLEQNTTRRSRLLAGAGSLSAVITVSLVLSIPIFYSYVSSRLGLLVMQFLKRRSTGFDSYFKLGSLNNMLQSQRTVLRVSGKFHSTLRLRGLVYSRYLGRYWVVPPRGKVRILDVPKQTTSIKDKKHLMTVEFVGGNTETYFVPLRVARLASPDGQLRIDPMGIVKPLVDQTPTEVSFHYAPTHKRAIAGPGKAELQIPRKLRAPLTKLAKEWTKGATTRARQLHMLRTKLQQSYKYSLNFKRPKKGDPLLDFLFKNKQGHCEYFASALALMARTLTIPTRVVGGYLVYEYNHLGGYYIVRERNAHAWVEAWLPGKGWSTQDATPPGGLDEFMPKKATTMAAFTDLLRRLLRQLRERLSRMSMLELFLYIGAFVLFWVFIRLVRRWRNKGTQEAMKQPDYDAPLPSFADFEAALQSVLRKRESETLERYARRLRQERKEPSASEAAQIIMDYASYRYGKIGDPAILGKRMQTWLANER
jgi:transglutaminase-like putative cysteine protease